MNSRTKLRRRSSKAQGLVEFALVLPILLSLIMASMDFGWMLFNYVQLNNGLREALRYGSVPSFSGTNQYADCRGIYNRIEQLAPMAGIQDNQITVYYDKGYSTGSSDTTHVVGTCSVPGPYTSSLSNGQRVVIVMTPTVKFLTPFFRSLWPAGLQFTYRGSRTIYPGGVDVQ